MLIQNFFEKVTREYNVIRITSKSLKYMSLDMHLQMIYPKTFLIKCISKYSHCVCYDWVIMTDMRNL